MSEAEARAASSESDGDGESSSEDARAKTPLRKEESEEERLVLMSTFSGLRAESTTLGRRIGCSSALHQNLMLADDLKRLDIKSCLLSILKVITENLRIGKQQQ